MAQTKEGAQKTAAKHYGITVDQYLEKIKTENYCNKCKQWKSRSLFNIDNSRSTGLHKNCNDCRWKNGGKKKPFFKKGQPSPFKGKTHTEQWKQNHSVRNSGKNNPNWKGGTTNLIMQIRNTATFKVWIINVYYNGKFTCCKCKAKKIGNNILLDADHIYPLSKLIADYKITTVEQALLTPAIWDLENGRCLCRKCHKQTKTWGVNANKKIKNGKD